jgi:hypothetical protein
LWIGSKHFGAFGARDAILSIEDVCRAAIAIAHGAGVWQRFDLSGALLAVAAIADAAHDRPAERFEFDAAARACCGHDGRARHLLVIAMRLPSRETLEGCKIIHEMEDILREVRPKL